MEEHARRRVEALAAAGIRGFVLKKGSPSCGLGGVPVFGAAGGGVAAEVAAGAAGSGPATDCGAAAQVGTDAGVFARTLMEGLPGLPVVEEDRLDDPDARRDFIARVAAYQPLKRSAIEGT
jgi:uncharacterized protein YbbK (DUF523 family)